MLYNFTAAREANNRRDESLLMFYRLTILSVIIAIGNVLFAFNQLFATIIIFLEVAQLLYLVLKKQITLFLVYYILFVSNCLEFSSFVGKEAFYNIKNFRIAGVNISIWILIAAVIVCSLKPIKVGKVRSLHPQFSFFSRYLLIINILAAITGFMLIIFNDNSIRMINDIYSKYVGMAYSMLFLPLCITFIFHYILAYEKEKVYVISYALQAVFFGSVAQTLASFLLNICGVYGGAKILLISNISFVIPLMLILCLDKNHIVYRKTTFLIAVIGTVLVLYKNANGKHIILLLIVGFVFLLSMIRDKTINKKLYIFVLFAMFVVSSLLIFPELKKNSIIFSSKFNQAFSLLKFGQDEWIKILANSPKMRVSQFINVIIEYEKKPWLFLFGKGYLGSVKDYVNMFGRQTTGAYTFDEWEIGTFYNLHELSSQLLMFGLAGVVCSVYLIILVFKKYTQNIWILIGTYWFIILYGYSFTLSVFCLVALLFGLLNEDKNETNRDKILISLS